MGLNNRVSSLLVTPLAEILTIIKECDVQRAAVLYHVPRLLELLPETVDVSRLGELSPGFIDQATKLRAKIDGDERVTFE